MAMKGPWDKNWDVCQQNFGKGGQGTTHLVCRTGAPAEKAVLKILKNNKSPQARRRMYREVASLKTMDDAGGNVPRVLEHNTEEFENEGVQLFVVMEYVPGQTLEQAVQETGGLSLEQSIAVAQGICATIQKGHEGDVLHRDLKPQNVVVRDRDWQNVTILDYGLSFNASEQDDELTQTSENFANRFLDLPETNTPGGDHRDPRSDITAICGILYYCLTAQRPGQLRDGNNLPPHRRPGHSVEEKLRGDDRVRQLNALFDRAFSLDLNGRLQTVDELAQRLNRVVSGASNVPRDPMAVAKKATEMLRSGADRKTLLADLAQAVKEVLPVINNHVDKLRREMSHGSIVVLFEPLAMGDVPTGLEQVAAHPFRVKIGVQHHEFQRWVLYNFGAQGNRCCIVRSIANYDAQPKQPGFVDEEEIASFEWNEKPDVDVIVEDVDRSISAGIDYLTRKIVARGVIE